MVLSRVADAVSGQSLKKVAISKLSIERTLIEHLKTVEKKAHLSQMKLNQENRQYHLSLIYGLKIF